LTSDNWTILGTCEAAAVARAVVSEASPIANLDFDFHDSDTGYLTHGLHPYPAKYIPQIPAALIERLSKPGETVADIFCGSGTTLVEAMLHGRNAVGIDANPLACLIAEAKTARIDKSEHQHLMQLAAKAEELATDIARRQLGTLFGSGSFVSTASRPTSPALDFWFESFVIEELAEVLSWCRALPTAQTQCIGLVAFSSIIVTVSKQDSDTRYVRREKRIAPGDTMSRFSRALRSAAQAVSSFTEKISTLGASVACRVLQGNILHGPNVPTFDLMVCSPPYPNAYSYHLYHMTRMVWLGFDQALFKREEIGSHRKYSSKGANGATAETFRQEMEHIFCWLRLHLRAGGFACFVIGDSTIRGEKVSNVKLISEIAHRTEFREVARLSRRLQATKKAFNPAIGKIKEEHVLVLRNS